MTITTNNMGFMDKVGMIINWRIALFATNLIIALVTAIVVGLIALVAFLLMTVFA